MSLASCAGCGASLPLHPRARNPRKWCSEACRIATYRRDHPHYRASQAELAARHHRATYVPVRHELRCVECGDRFVGRIRSARYCGDRCKFRAQARRRRARLKVGAAEVVDFAEICKRDRWVCQICDACVDADLAYPHPRSASLDHVVPLSLDGPHAPSNCQLAHLDCNRRKGARLEVA